MRTELVTTLKRRATELLAELEAEREPILITQPGVPGAYLVDVETFDALRRRVSLLEGIARGERAVDDGAGDIPAGASRYRWNGAHFTTRRCVTSAP